MRKIFIVFLVLLLVSTVFASNFSKSFFDNQALVATYVSPSYNYDQKIRLKISYLNGKPQLESSVNYISSFREKSTFGFKYNNNYLVKCYKKENTKQIDCTFYSYPYLFLADSDDYSSLTANNDGPVYLKCPNSQERIGIGIDSTNNRLELISKNKDLIKGFKDGFVCFNLSNKHVCVHKIPFKDFSQYFFKLFCLNTQDAVKVKTLPKKESLSISASNCDFVEATSFEGSKNMKSILENQEIEFYGNKLKVEKGNVYLKYKNKECILEPNKLYTNGKIFFRVREETSKENLSKRYTLYYANKYISRKRVSATKEDDEEIFLTCSTKKPSDWPRIIYNYYKYEGSFKISDIEPDDEYEFVTFKYTLNLPKPYVVGGFNDGSWKTTDSIDFRLFVDSGINILKNKLIYCYDDYGIYYLSFKNNKVTFYDISGINPNRMGKPKAWGKIDNDISYLDPLYLDLTNPYTVRADIAGNYKRVAKKALYGRFYAEPRINIKRICSENSKVLIYRYAKNKYSYLITSIPNDELPKCRKPVVPSTVATK